MDTIIEIVRVNMSFVIIYAFIATFAIIITIATTAKRKRKYMVWKKDTVNLYVFKREWERNDDEFLEELFLENDRLTKENKLLKEKVSDLSFISTILLMIMVLASILTSKIKGRTK